MKYIDVGAPVHRLSRRASEMYAKYSFTDVDERRGYCYSSTEEWWKTIQPMFERAMTAVSQYEQAGGDKGLCAQERENLEKMMVCWRLKGYGTLVATSEDIVDDEMQAVELRALIVERRNQYLGFLKRGGKELLRKLTLGARIPINKGKGPPFFYSGNDRAAAIPLAWLAKGVRSYNELVDKVSDYDSQGLPPCTITFLRTQDSAKEQEQIGYDGYGVFETGRKTRMSKMRPVNSVPFHVNWLLSPTAECLAFARKNVDAFNTGEGYEAEALSQVFRYMRATDKGKYDKTIGLSLGMMYNQEMVAPITKLIESEGIISASERRLIIEIDAATYTMQELRPPTNKGELARLIRTIGTLRSGTKLTTPVGTDIGRAGTRRRLQMAGVERDVVAINQGDDTLMFSNSKRALDLYFKQPDLGFIENEAEDNAFLQRHYPGGYTYLGRMISKTINREPAYEARNVFEAALGMQTRKQLLRGHPLANVYGECMSESKNEALTSAWEMANTMRPIDLMRVVASFATLGSGSGAGARASNVRDLLIEAGRANGMSAAEMEDMISRLDKIAGASNTTFGVLREEAARADGAVIERMFYKEAANVVSEIRTA